MKYLGIRTSLVTMQPPWVGHTTACRPNRVDGIYDVTIARHQTLRSHPHSCLAYINQAKQIFIVPYWNAIIFRYWIGTEPQNCINWSVLDRTNPLFPGSFEHFFLLVWTCVVEHSWCRHQRSWLDTVCFQAAAEDILVWHLILSWLVAVRAFVTI